MTAHRYHAHHAFGTGVRHQRLEHLMLVEAELGGRLHAVAVIHMVVGVLVFVYVEFHARLLQLDCRRSGTRALIMLAFLLP